MSVFVDVATAARIERAEGEFIAACSREVGRQQGIAAFQLPVCGGFATYAGPDSPFNKVAGVGFAGLPSAEELDEIERRYAERSATVSFEVSSLADPEIFEQLTARGYQLVSFENVLVRTLDGALGDLPAGIDVRRAEDQLQTWLDVAVESALHPDTDGIPQYEEFPRDVLEQAELAGHGAGAQLYLARIDGEPAGAAGVRFADGIAQLTGAGTVPALRRRGVQTALVARRLLDARANGCDLAVVTTQPGSPSHANNQRRGFDLAYARAVLAFAP